MSALVGFLKKGIFAWSEEALSHLIVGLFITLALFAFLQGWSLSLYQMDFLRLIELGLFFNSLHVMTTYINVLYRPETRHILNANKLSVAQHTFIFLLISFVFLGWGPHGFFDGFYMRGFVVYAILIMPFAHSWRQSIGVSLLYNRAHWKGKSLQEKQAFAARERVSRRLEHFGGWMGVLASSLMLMTKMPKKYLLLSTELSTNLGIVFIGISVLAFILSFVILKDRELMVQKTAFSLRHVLRFFVANSFFCYLGNAACHGTEYMFIDKKIRRHEKRSPKLGSGAIALCGFLYLFKLFVDGYQQGQHVLQIDSGPVSTFERCLFSFGLGLSFYHYYLDAMLFRMKNPRTRKIMSQLLGEHPERDDREVFVPEQVFVASA